MSILKATARPAASIRVERVRKEKKAPLKPLDAGVKKSTYNATHASNKFTATTTSSKSLSNTSSTKIAKLGKATQKAKTATRSSQKPFTKKAASAKLVPGLVPISSFGSRASSMRSILGSPPQENTPRDSIEIKTSTIPRGTANNNTAYRTPSPTPDAVSTPQSRFESALRALSGLDFGPTLRLTATRQTELASALAFNKFHAPATTTADLLRSYLTEVLRICVSRGELYKSTARRLALGQDLEDHKHYFFCEVAVALDSRHAQDNMWTPGYGAAGLRPRVIMDLVDAVLGARLSSRSKGIQTELTMLLDKWVDIEREKMLKSGPLVRSLLGESILKCPWNIKISVIAMNWLGLRKCW